MDKSTAEVKPFFDWQYGMGMTIKGQRHTVYKDWKHNVTKECHSKDDVSFWADDSEIPFASEEDLKNYVIERSKTNG
jgi:hypothetical protein